MNQNTMQSILQVGDPVQVAYRGGGGRVYRRDAKVVTVNKGCADVRFLEDGDEKRIKFKDLAIGEDIAARVPKKREPVVARRRASAPNPVQSAVVTAAHPVADPELIDAPVANPEETPRPLSNAQENIVQDAPKTLNATPSTTESKTSSLNAWLEMGLELEKELGQDLAAVEMRQDELRREKAELLARESALEAEHTRVRQELARVEAATRGRRGG